jgi:hypothetical protein
MADRSLHKITIWSYKDKEFTTKMSEFKVPINPETYAQNLKVNLDTNKGHGRAPILAINPRNLNN